MLDDLNDKLEEFKEMREDIRKTAQKLENLKQEYKAKEHSYFKIAEGMTFSEWVEAILRTTK